MRSSPRRNTACVLVTYLAAVLLLPAPVRADAPLPPPAGFTVRAPHAACTARADAAAGLVTVTNGATTWTWPGWHRELLLGDDCRTLGIGYDGGNLLDDADKRPDTRVLTFVTSSGAVRTIHLGDLYPDLSVLPRTASHWAWMQSSQWDGRRWTVRSVDNRVLVFQP